MEGRGGAEGSAFGWELGPVGGGLEGLADGSRGWVGVACLGDVGFLHIRRRIRALSFRTVASLRRRLDVWSGT